MKHALAAFVLLISSVAWAQTQPRVFIESAETVDAGNSANKAKQIDFGAAIAAALVKMKVPVAVVTAPEKAQWAIKTVSSQKEDTTGSKVPRCSSAWAGSPISRARFRSLIARAAR